MAMAGMAMGGGNDGWQAMRRHFHRRAMPRQIRTHSFREH
jgi:hypothetical protein